MTKPATDHLHTRAEQAGLARRYSGFWGAEVEVPDATLQAALHAMGADEHPAESTSLLPPVHVVDEGQATTVALLRSAPTTAWTLEDEHGQQWQGTVAAHAITLPASLPAGYYRLWLDTQPTHDCTVVVAPARCWVPDALANEGKEGQRWWGPCVQLYALRSARNWGMGDLGDLRALVEVMAGLGADFVGLNPLHTLFAQRPEVASPYSPSSRETLNPLYIAIEDVPEYAEGNAVRTLVQSVAFQRRLAAQRSAEMVDYAGVAAAKHEALALLWQHFSHEHLAHGTARAAEFHRFVQSQGEGLRLHALFEALQAHFVAADPAVWGWPAWPEAWRDPEAPAVQQFAQAHAEQLQYHCWLQWLAESQLQAAQAHAKALGMGLGLYRDLAVGVNEGGADTWRQRSAYALGMYVGAPPDPLNALGQNWGLPPLNPLRLRPLRFAPFIDTLRANMRHAGALRLDHVMGLMRLFWLPPHDVGGGEGTYAAYPLDALLGILALESVRHRCMVIGEDLGNVAPAMRSAMQSRALLSYRPLFFERDAATQGFAPPATWPAQALAVASTHDLPTLRGFWQGEDLAVQTRLQLFPSEAARAAELQTRTQDRLRLSAALEREGLAPEGMSAALDQLPDDMDAPLVDAVYRYLARTPCWLLGVQLEDVCGQLLQVNVPGTTEDRFPNWRRKTTLPVDAMATDARLLAFALALRQERAAAVDAAPPSRLKVLFVTPECAPWVKTGGLGDVSAALPQALGALGHDVKVLMPAYPGLAARAPLPPVVRTIDIPAAGPWPAARLLCSAPQDGAALVLLDCPGLYERPGGPYVDATGNDHGDNAWRFGFLCHVAAWLGSPDSPWPHWQADVVHGNDWPCGLAPLYLAQAPVDATRPRAATVLTIHNLAFQGVYPMDVAPQLGIAPEWRTVHGVEYWGQMSMLKAGLQTADAITTVSPTYAREIQQAALGFGLDGVLRDKAQRLHGILNGIDTRVWNPQHDPLIAQPFSAHTLQHKAANKQALQQRCGLAPRPDALLLGLVGRLTWQKGIDLVVALLPWLLEQGCQLAVLGQGEPALQDALRDAAARRPDAVSVSVDFNEALAHNIEAGADVFLMPSRFEPCGLNQMYSQAYGTLPVVHATGGLADSVEDVRVEAEGVSGTGFVMAEPTVPALQHALQRVLDLFAQPEDWQRVQAQGMARDFGWAGSAREYESVYRKVLAGR